MNIKKLVWQEDKFDDSNLTAKTPLWDYHITYHEEDYYLDIEFDEHFLTIFDPVYDERNLSIEDLKQLAQDHFVKRVTECHES